MLGPQLAQVLEPDLAQVLEPELAQVLAVTPAQVLGLVVKLDLALELLEQAPTMPRKRSRRRVSWGWLVTPQRTISAAAVAAVAASAACGAVTTVT